MLLTDTDFKDHVNAFSQLYNSQSRVLNRMRLCCSAPETSDQTSNSSADRVRYPFPEPIHAMNEITLSRGRNPHLAIIEVWVDGRLLTEAIVSCH